ncbi:MAG: InlB B-repeat-containing protein [Clostridiales bacterium]|nr:InlB B-repeat-containing protein [Clostridiales bacterium]
MKKIATILLCILMAVALCVGVVACKDNSNKRHTVTFKGEGVTTFTQTVDDGATVIEPNDPERDGYQFDGWFRDGATASYDFSTPVKEDFTLTAKWSEKYAPQAGLAGQGTSDSPYLIDSAEDIEEMATKINGGQDGYADAYYRLMVDIDMSNETFTPIGDSADNAFSGDLDGNGHKISGINVKRTVRNQGIIGLFGYTYMAIIHDLNVEYSYSLECYAASASVYAGGVVGYAINTNFTNVTSTGTMETALMSDTTTYLGGIAGLLKMDSDSNGTLYIAYVENCNSSLTTTIVDEDKAEGGSLESAMLGGLFGRIYSYGAVAIVNCATSGSIHGGKYTGGLVGYLDNNVSIIDSLSSATVQPTASEVCYVGGLVGMASGDALILDSVFTGAVYGKQATSATYTSYTGGIVGYSTEDDYMWYYTAGLAVVNSYYTGRITNSKGTIVSKVGSSATFTEDLLFNTLKWERDCWTVSGTTATPTSVKRSDLHGSYTVTLVSNGQTVGTEQYAANNGYSVIGSLDELSNNAPYIFWDWELDDGVLYRSYMPVVKPITVTAKWSDASQIAGYYNGTGTLHETNGAGTIILYENGTFEWVSSSLWKGTYRFDGEHILGYCGFTGDFSGTITMGNPITFTFDYDAGMSGSVTYEFVKLDQAIQLIGEYVSEIGDILTFAADGTVTFQSSNFNNGNTIRGDYVIEGTSVIFGGNIAGAFTSITATLNVDGSVSMDTVAKPGSYGFTNTTFKKIVDIDYSKEGFVGKYTLMYIYTGSSNESYGNLNELELFADGSATLSTRYSTRQSRYYYIDLVNIRFIKYIDEGHVSLFYYDSELGIFWGTFKRGESAYSYSVLAPESQGRVYCASTYDRSLMVFFTETNTYVIENGKLIRLAEVTGKLVNGSVITVDGQGYYLKVRNLDDYNEYCTLYPIGDENGSYSYNGRAFSLDGIGNIVEGGKSTGFYSVFSNHRVVVVFDDDTLFSFDYTAANAAGGTVTPLATLNEYFGIWYSGAYYTPLDDDGYATDKVEPVYDPMYHKLILDGYGNTAFYYHKYGQTYTPNWSDQWGTYYLTSTGIHAQFNSVQPADIVFYYDMQVAYSSNFGYLKEKTFAKAGYNGPTTPPVIDSSWAGRYTGQDSENKQVIFNLRADCTGDFKGAPFVAVYDGDKTLRFTLGNVNYTVVFDGSVTIQYGSESIVLTKGGEILEVIPAALVGTWTCSNVEGYGASGTYTVVIQENGSISFNGTPVGMGNYDSSTFVITVSGAGKDFTLTYNPSDNNFTVEWSDDENRNYHGVFTKAE